MNLLTIQEAADALKVSEATVRRLIKRGAFAAFKVGERGQLRIKASDLEEYVEAHRVKVASGAFWIEEPKECEDEVGAKR